MSEQHQSVEELRAALQHRERQIAAIRRISNELVSHTSPDEMLRETLQTAIEVVDADVGSLQLYDAENDTLVFRHVQDPSAPNLVGLSFPVTQGIAGRVFRTGVSDITQKVSERSDFNRAVDEKTGYHTESMLTVPLKRPDGGPLGIMQVLNARQTFDRQDLEVLEVLCAQAGAVIENARLAEEARRATIVNVMGDVAHDIKNMLSPIQSGIWTLRPFMDEMFEALDALCARGPQSGNWPGAVCEALETVRENYDWILDNALDGAERVKSRTKEIADAIKGELAPPVFAPCHLNETAHEVAKSLRPVAESQGVALLFDLDATLPYADCDEKQLYNALYNLVNNAIPETPPGGSVTIRTRAPQEGEDTLLIEVQDTGRGIPEHVRAKLFTPQAISTKPGGTGLGTGIVAGVVKRHRGTISVASEEGAGSTFTIRLPLRQPS